MNILEFANPINFWWAALALPIIALYILKVRLRRIPASTLMFWNQLYDEKKPRSWWQRLRHWLSLLLQLAFLMLLVAALVDPLWSWQKQRQRRIVLVLDNSASMQAVDSDGESRLERAKEAAVMQVRSLRDGDQMALVSAGGRPQVLWGMTNHGRWLTEAINELPATDAPSAITESVALAKRLLSGLEGEGETIVITDGCIADLDQIQDDSEVRLYGVGSSQDNVGITRYQVRRSLTDVIGYQVLVDITNFSELATDCRLELDLEGELVDVLPVELEPNATETRIVDHTAAAGGRLVARLDVEDGLIVDNSAMAILPRRRPVPVTLVTEGNLFLGSVLSSIPLVELTIVDKSPTSTESTASIHVFDKQVPQELPNGPVLVVDPRNDCSLWKMGDEVDQPIVATVDSESPLTQHVRLDNVLFPGAKQLEFLVPAIPLIQDPYDAPMFARIRRPGGDVVILSCDLEKGDLPLRIAFPVLMKNTIEWFQGESGQLRPAVSCGSLVSVPVDSPSDQERAPEDSSTTDSDENEAIVVSAGDNQQQIEYELVAPGGDVSPITASSGEATVGPLLTTGLWILRSSQRESSDEQPATTDTSSSGGDSDQPSSPEATEWTPGTAEAGKIGIACNLTSPEESDLRPRLDLPRVEQAGLSLLGGRSAWFYLTLLAAGLIAAEWWLYQRRIVG